MPRFSNNKEGIKASEEYNSKVMELYEQYCCDPDDPNEYIGLDDMEKEIKRCMLEEGNRILLEKIERFVNESKKYKPKKVLIYKDGRYRFSLKETIKARIRYYLRKWRKPEFI